MREDDFLKGGRVLLVTEPIKGQDGILKLTALAKDIMNHVSPITALVLSV